MTPQNNSAAEGADAYSKRIGEAIAKEKEVRAQRRHEAEIASGDRAEIHITVVVTREQQERFNAETKRDPSRTREIFHAAALQISGGPMHSEKMPAIMPDDAVQNPTFPDQYEVPLVKTASR